MYDVRKALTLSLLAGMVVLGVACKGSNPEDKYRSEEFGSALKSDDAQTVDVELKKDGEIDMPKEIEAGKVVLAIKNDDSEAHGLAIERTDGVGSQTVPQSGTVREPQTGTMREPRPGSESESMREPKNDPLAEPGSEPVPQREPERKPGTEPQRTPGTEPQRTPGTEPLPGTQPPRDLGQTPSDMQGERRQLPDMSGSRAMGSGENLLQNFRLQPGEEKEVSLTLLPGSYRVYCPEMGHRQTDAEEIIVTVVAKDE